MSDLEQLLSGEQPEQVAELSEQEPEQEPTQEPEEQAASAPEPEAAPEPKAEKQEPQMVPVSVVQGLRDEIRALKSQPRQEPKPAPDFYEDPQAAIQHQIEPVRNQVLNARLDMSQAIAEQQFGAEVVGEAMAALEAVAGSNPAAVQQIMQARSPYHELVNWHQRQKVMSEIGDNPDAWKAKERERIRAELQAELVSQQARDKAARPAPSMADETGVGGGAKSSWAGPTPLDSIL